jgi:RNA polymerase sigma factor (sigma-70 family)
VNADRRHRRLAEFLAAEWSHLVATVRARLEDAADRDAEDVVQDVATSLFAQDDVTESVIDLSAYVYRSLRNRIVDLYRARRATVSLDGPSDGGGDAMGMVLHESLESLEPDAMSRLMAAERTERLHAALDALPSEQRAVLFATEWEGRRFADLASEWQVPIGTLLARKHRALKRLRELLMRRDVGP